MVIAAKADVVGIPVSVTSYDDVLDALDARPTDRALVVTVCNVHSVMSARRNPVLREAIETSAIATPDGMPLVWTLRRSVNPDQTRVYGPELMRRALAASDMHGWRHFLFGSTSETLELLETAIADLAPSAEVVGAYSPPFSAPTPEQDASDVERIRSSGANIVWVGLGMPKQELWMLRMADSLPGVALVGVGAAFDFIAGTVDEAPDWMMRAGLEWLYRLAKEPRRLWRRYVWNNPAFVVLVTLQLIGQRFSRKQTTDNDAMPGA